MSLSVFRLPYLECEKQLDGVGKGCWWGQTKPSDQAEEEEVEKGPAEAQCWGMACRQRHM